MPTIVVDRERFLEVVDFIYNEGFQLLLDVTAVDLETRASPASTWSTTC